MCDHCWSHTVANGLTSVSHVSRDTPTYPTVENNRNLARSARLDFLYFKFDEYLSTYSLSSWRPKLSWVNCLSGECPLMDHLRQVFHRFRLTTSELRERQNMSEKYPMFWLQRHWNRIACLWIKTSWLFFPFLMDVSYVCESQHSLCHWHSCCSEYITFCSRDLLSWITWTDKLHKC